MDSCHNTEFKRVNKMTKKAKTFLVAGSLNAMLAVILGAFGSHGLKTIISIQLMATYNTGVQYHFYHALGLLAVGLLMQVYGEIIWLKWSGWLMLTGIILFSGSLYLLALTATSWIGVITPFGGLCFIIAWGMMAWSVYRKK